MNYAVSNECLLAKFLIRADYRCVFVCYVVVAFVEFLLISFR